MNRRLSGLSLSLLAIALAGCSMLPESRKIEYKSAGKAPTLEIPPDLSQIARDDKYLVPDAAGKGSATFSAYSADRTPQAQAQNTAVLPQVDKVRASAVAAGRNPDDIKLFMGINVIVAPTEAQALAKRDEYLSYASAEAGVAHFSASTAIDFSRYELDEPIQYVKSNAIQSAVLRLRVSSDIMSTICTR